MSSAFEHTLAAIDALHAQDPRPTTLADGTSHPQELIYAQRMSRWLERLQETPSELLRIAVRAQHLQVAVARPAFYSKVVDGRDARRLDE